VLKRPGSRRDLRPEPLNIQAPLHLAAPARPDLKPQPHPRRGAPRGPNSVVPSARRNVRFGRAVDALLLWTDACPPRCARVWAL